MWIHVCMYTHEYVIISVLNYNGFMFRDITEYRDYEEDKY